MINRTEMSLLRNDHEWAKAVIKNTCKNHWGSVLLLAMKMYGEVGVIVQGYMRIKTGIESPRGEDVSGKQS